MNLNGAVSVSVDGDKRNGVVLSKTGGSGSIAERRAFNAERINTPRFRTISPLASPSAVAGTAGFRSPWITIPDGISPAALLDSPILLPNSQPSPTTGTFPFPLLNHDSPMLNTLNPLDGDKGSDVGSPFAFKSFTDLDTLPVFSSSENQFSKEVPTHAYPLDSVMDSKDLNNGTVNDSHGDLQPCHSDVASDRSSLQKEPVEGEDVGTRHILEKDQKGTSALMGTVRTSEDGYSWRKYGQKQVKGSEYPRSYYKCTHPNCEVKKKVEHSHDGHITEIIYKGIHNHQKPQPRRRALPGLAFPPSEMLEPSESNAAFVKDEGGSVWTTTRKRSDDVKLGSDGKADGPERTSSTSAVTEVSDPLSNTHGKSVGLLESAETPEFSYTHTSREDDSNDDGTTQGSITLVEDADDESESKRRKVESGFIETTLSSRAVREPRVVVQIESEVDILDDGYRWRKYGQKVVKGNPNPRSYYKCTSPGCSVRKHVERAPHNIKYVITTYEGKHNHEVPAARNSSHANSSASNLPPVVANAQSTVPLPGGSLGLKPEQHFQNVAPCFDTKPELNYKYIGPSFSRNLSSEAKIGPYMYQMKFPPLRNPMPYASFSHNATQQPGSVGLAVPNFPMSLPMGLSSSSNLSLSGINLNDHGNRSGLYQPFPLGQPFKESAMSLLRPKEELKDDIIYDAFLPIVGNANAASSSSSSYR